MRREHRSAVSLGNPYTYDESEVDLRAETYTPLEIIKCAHASMGGIDLDPASSAEANECVRAKRYIALPDSGLDHEWTGNVWVNPPFNGGYLRMFAEYLLTQPVRAACFLGPVVGGGNWIDKMTAASVGIVMLRQRLPWWGPAKSIPGVLFHSVWLLGECDLEPWFDCPMVSAVTATVWSQTEWKTGFKRYDLGRKR